MIELNYKKVGTGSKTMILMHEWMGDHTNYDTSIPFLNTHDFTYIFVDFRGYGISKDIEGEFTFEEMVSDIKNLVIKLGLKEFYLLGHSMSSLIAQKLAMDLKEQVIELFLITPILPTGIKMKESAKQKLLDDVQNENNVIENVVTQASKRYNNTWKNYRINLAHTCSTLKAKVSYMNMYLSTDFSEEIKGLDTKITVLTGKLDLPAFHKNSLEKRFMNYYLNISFIECLEAGHYPMIECPVFFSTVIDR
jgi:pimeloyl-ACP methyl ester carboxylesterase